MISPLLANIALHQVETEIKQSVTQKASTSIIRYADDFVILHPNLKQLQKAKATVERWLAEMGLNLKAAKTRIAHTRNEHEGEAAGFDFLGFTVRQFAVGKYQRKQGFKTIIKPSQKSVAKQMAKVEEWLKSQKDSPQHTLLLTLNPHIKGSTLCSHHSSKRTFHRMDHLLYHKLQAWAHRHHANKGKGWRFHRYWQVRRGRMRFSDGLLTLIHYSNTPIRRHIKVRGTKSPLDGDWPYSATRLGPTRFCPNVSLLC